MGFIRVEGGCDVGIMIISARETEIKKRGENWRKANRTLILFNYRHLPWLSETGEFLSHIN